MRRVLPGVLGLALLAGCGTRPELPVPEITGTPSPTRSTVECSAEDVEISALSTDAAMGIRVLALELVNCGARPYTVHGYPGVRLFDEEGEQIEVAVGQGSASIASVPDFDAPPRKVTLGPGEKARSALLWRNLVTDSTVDATTAYHLEAASAEGEPWQQVPLIVPDELNGVRTVEIDLGNTGKLGVQAWQKA